MLSTSAHTSHNPLYLTCADEGYIEVACSTGPLLGIVAHTARQRDLAENGTGLQVIWA